MKVFVIGIDSDKTDQEKAVKKCNSLGLEGVAFKGVNGRKDGVNIDEHLSVPAIFQTTYMKNRTTHWQMPVKDPRGALGCSLSHYNVWKTIVDEDIPVAIVAESDMVPKSNIQERVQLALDHKDEWDLVLLGYTKHNYYLKDTNLTTTHGNFKKGKYGFTGTHGYMVTKKGAETLMKYFHPIEYQTDAYFTMLVYLEKLRTWYDPTKPIGKLGAIGRKSLTQVGNSGRLSFCHGAPLVLTPSYIAFYVAFAILFILAIVFAVLYAIKKR